MTVMILSQQAGNPDKTRERFYPVLVPCMIKIMLKRRKESDIYLVADRKHRRSTQITMKVDKVSSSSADEGRSAG